MLPDLFRSLSDEAWLAVMNESAERRTVLGHAFPPFPSPEFQENFVGSSYQAALQEAFGFYKLVKARAAAAGNPLSVERTSFLDFGAGWGRFTRMFWRDLDEAKMFACDVNEKLMFMNQWLGLPGRFQAIVNGEKLPYRNRSFDFIIAYSVFTHLPEALADHWRLGLARVSRPGAIVAVTFWTERFFELIEHHDQTAPSGWTRAIMRHAARFPELRAGLKANRLAFLPNGGFELNPAEYGDAVVTREYVSARWGQEFRLLEWIDDPARFTQAVAIFQRR